MTFSQKRKDGFIKLSIVLTIAFVVLVVSQEYFFSIGPIKELEQKHIDERFQRRGVINIKDTAKVIIVEITQTTYDGIPTRWPWPRNVYAKVLHNLNEAGVKAIGIDLVMSTPDQFSPLNDTAMFNAIREFRNVVVAGKISNTEGSANSTVTMNNGTNAEMQSTGYSITKKNEDYNSVYFDADSSIGIVEVISDDDGVTRRYLPFRYAPSTDRRVPTFSYAVVNKYFGLPSLYTAEITPDYFVVKDRKIPRFDRISMLVNYYGPSRTFKYFDFLDILDDKEFKTKDETDFNTDINTWDDPVNGYLHSGIFKDKIVLIGSTLPEDKDIMPISFGRGEKKGDNLINGVEIHANAIQNILSYSFIIKESTSIEIALIFILALASFFISSLLKEIKIKYSFLLELFNVIIILGALVGFRMISFYLFDHDNILVTVMSANMSIVLGYIGSTAYHFITERRQKGVIKGMFSQYVNATIVDELISNPDNLKLGGQRRNMTIFFSDIAGFSTFSENKEPEDLISFLNEYLSEMTRLIFENKGTLDKYIGDAVMAFWGAPVPLENHHYLCCNAALDMQKRLVELQEKWKREGQPLIHARMGINSGDMVVGNVGGTQRFDYTVMGDCVNLASRLEGANKEYGTNIMISESTYEAVQNLVITRELDFLVVKGKTLPVRVYELIGNKNDVLPTIHLDCYAEYIKGLELYRAQEFQKAIEQFNKALSIHPADEPSSVYSKRCELLLAHPPGPDWDGVFHMTRK